MDFAHRHGFGKITTFTFSLHVALDEPIKYRHTFLFLFVIFLMITDKSDTKRCSPVGICKDNHIKRDMQQYMNLFYKYFRYYILTLDKNSFLQKKVVF